MTKKKNEQQENKETMVIDQEKEKLHNNYQELNDKFLRLNAEMQNMRRRYEENISELIKYDGQQVILAILPTIDNFERAIKMDDIVLDDQVSKFLSGFKLMYSQLKTTLEELGVSEIECLNKDFDHTTMEAVLTEKVTGVEAHKVIDVLQKGYLYKEKVIRFAMVKVSE